MKIWSLLPVNSWADTHSANNGDS